MELDCDTLFSRQHDSLHQKRPLRLRDALCAGQTHTLKLFQVCFVIEACHYSVNDKLT
jgi:hypothetical protein